MFQNSSCKRDKALARILNHLFLFLILMYFDYGVTINVEWLNLSMLLRRTKTKCKFVQGLFQPKLLQKI